MTTGQLQRGTLRHRLPDPAGLDAVPVAGDLDIGGAGGAVGAEQHRQVGHALAPDDADLDGLLVADIRHVRGEPGVEEEHPVYRPPRIRQTAVHSQVLPFQIPVDHRQIFGREIVED
jgi:hypothetical protein